MFYMARFGRAEALLDATGKCGVSKAFEGGRASSCLVVGSTWLYSPCLPVGFGPAKSRYP